MSEQLESVDDLTISDQNIGRLVLSRSVTEKNAVMTDPETVISGSVKQLAYLIFLSYRFSQGDGVTQTNLLNYIKNKFHPDLLEPGNPQYEDVQAAATKMVTKYFINDKVHPDGRSELDPQDSSIINFQVATSELETGFRRWRRPIVPIVTPVVIAKDIISRDTLYLDKPGGRPIPDIQKMTVNAKSSRDPYASLFIDYGILGKPTGNPVYDKIFADISAEETIRDLAGSNFNYIKFITDKYLRRHPHLINEPKLLKLKKLADGLVTVDELESI